MKYSVGIDPGITNGFAVWHRKEKQFTQIKDLTYTQLIDLLYKIDRSTVYVMRIEDPNLNPPVFMDKFDTITAKGKSLEKSKLKIAQNIGANKQGAKIIIDLAKHLGFEVQTIKPVSTKWTNEQFYQYTKTPGKFSQHGIDAARLCFNF